jgi:hypothetical protein
MLKIMHKGIHANLPINKTGLSGIATDDALNAYIQSLKGGRAVTLTSLGVALADAGAGSSFLGFLINDAAGYPYENIPALASGFVSVAYGNCVITTDQINPVEVFDVGDLIYIGSGANAGLVTKIKPAGAGANDKAIGMAYSGASVAAPELSILVFGPTYA